ncbi:MAG: tetrapyrrole methylase [Deltaproteobacteria bacterium]|nr:tetrapyrrole methylase [Deltaproteobacteria bacterium]
MSRIVKHYLYRLLLDRRIWAIFILGFSLALIPIQGKATGLYLVGLGPGDPDLATVKAISLIQDADVIYTFGGDIRERFAAYLKDKDVRELRFDIFTRHSMVKSKGKPTGSKVDSSLGVDKERRSFFTEIRQAVKEGKQVVFIDNGDPLIYGPWVGMLEELKDINPEVVPGVSSFNAGLAALKKDGTWAPNTHSVILTTDQPQSQDSLEALSAHKCSMVIFTHRTRFGEIIHKLQTQYAPTTPIAVVFYAGFKEKQSTVNGTLETIESKINQETLPLEHIIFVGDFLTYDF